MYQKIDTVIQFSGLKPGCYEYEYELDDGFFERFENEEISKGKVNFHVILERRERLLLLKFAFHGTLQTTCDRCLGEMEVPVEGEETLCVKFSDTETSEDADVLYLPEDAYQIDLAQWMYEYVAVAMPMQKHHPDGECDPEMMKYISDERGETGDESLEVRDESVETDARWDALKQLLEK